MKEREDRLRDEMANVDHRSIYDQINFDAPELQMLVGDKQLMLDNISSEHAHKGITRSSVN